MNKTILNKIFNGGIMNKRKLEYLYLDSINLDPKELLCNLIFLNHAMYI